MTRRPSKRSLEDAVDALESGTDAETPPEEAYAELVATASGTPHREAAHSVMVEQWSAMIGPTEGSE